MNLSEFFYKDLNGPSESRKYTTDKGDVHNYINGYYSEEFSKHREDPLTILEIGFAYGGSVKLWRDWFVNGTIYCIEYDSNLLYEVDGVTIINADAYNYKTLELLEGIQFDYIIDDGPHTLESQVFAIEQYTKLLKPGGKLIVEDIQDIEHTKYMKMFAGSNQTKVVDLTQTAHKRYDDIIFEVIKN